MRFVADDIRVHTLGLSMNLSVRRVVVVRRHDLGLPLPDMVILHLPSTLTLRYGLPLTF